MKMSKGTLIAITAAFVLSIGVTFAVIKFKAPAAKPIGSPLTSLPTPLPSSAVVADKLYQDEAGFSFKYTSDLTITDDTPDDNIHYSRLKLKSPDGTMLELIVKDTPAQLEPVPPAAVDLKFGNIPANQSKTNGRLVTSAVANKILYQMTSPDTGYWQKIHSQIAASFVEGITSQPAAAAAFGSPQLAAEAVQDTIYEAEEIVE